MALRPRGREQASAAAGTDLSALTTDDDTFISPTGKRYQRLRQLGYGTFGICWGVLDTVTKIECVAKQIFIGNMSSVDAAKIRKEAELLQLVNHVNVLHCWESFDDGTFVVIITELCDGGDLAQLIKRLARAKQALDEQQIVDWAVQIADALAYLHDEKRILHRDVKSSNIFLTSGLVKLGDFGIARLLDTEDRATTLAGTPHYMSPEALSGDGYDAKSDVWALGCIVYELCALKKPFRGSSLVGVIRNICNDPLPLIDSERYPNLATIIPMLLNRDAEARLDAATFRMLPALSDARARNAALHKPHLRKRDGAQNPEDDSDDDEFFDVHDGSEGSSTVVQPATPEVSTSGVRDELSSHPPQLAAFSVLDHSADDVRSGHERLQSLPDVTAGVKAEASTMLSNAAAQIMRSDSQLDSETLGMQEAYESSGWSTIGSTSVGRVRSGPAVPQRSGSGGPTRTRSGSLSLQRNPILFETLRGAEKSPSADKPAKIAREIEQLKDQLHPSKPTDQGRQRGARANDVWNVTSLPSPYFTGRDEELQSIYTTFFVTSSGEGGGSPPPATAKRHGIWQLSGAGKTQLILKYGWQNRAAYPGGVFMVEADTVDRLRRSFAAIAYRLDSSKALKDGAGHAAVASCVCKLLSTVRKRWLLLIDGVNLPEVIELLGMVYLPSTGSLRGGHMLFSSRVATPEAWSTLGVIQPMTLTALDPRQSAELLVRYAREMYKATTWEVEQVIERMDSAERDALYLLAGSDDRSGLHGIPCALQQAGAYMMRTQCTFTQYHENFVDMGQKLVSERGEGRAKLANDEDFNRSATAWAINVQGLSSVGHRVLAAIGCLQPFQIPEPLLLNIARVDHARNEVAAGSAVAQTTETTSRMVHSHFDKYFLDELVARFSLLQLDYKTLYNSSVLQPEYSVHRLVRMVVRDTETEESLVTAETVALTAYYYTVRHRRYQTVTEADHRRRDELFDLSVHGLALLERFPDPQGHMALICGTVWRSEGYLSQFVGAYPEAVKRYERALELLERYYGPDGRENKEVAETVNQLGNVLSSMGAHTAALKRCEEALEMLQRVTGSDVDDATVASVLHRIATVHDELGDNGEALRFYEKALSMKQRLFGVGRDHKEIASTLYRLGNALEKQKEFQAALERYLEALHMKQRLYGDEEPRPDLAYCQYSIGSVLMAQGAHDEALVHLNEALDMRKRIYGAEAKHTSIAASYFGIGQCLMDSGKFGAALDEFNRALEIRVAIFGPLHKDVKASRKAVEECEQAALVGSSFM